MKNTKRFLALLLAVVMVIGMVPTAWATETEPTETTVPETTVPETTVPETTVPETTVPETTVPETTVPETTVPETTVPETTVPETTVPETTVPETTVPETTPAESTPAESTPEETLCETCQQVECTCPKACEVCGELEENCTCVPEESTTAPTEPESRLTGVIPAGTDVYANYTDEEGHTTNLEYNIVILEKYSGENGTNWYKFETDNWYGFTLSNDYAWVLAGDVILDSAIESDEDDEAFDDLKSEAIIDEEPEEEFETPVSFTKVADMISLVKTSIKTAVQSVFSSSSSSSAAAVAAVAEEDDENAEGDDDEGDTGDEDEDDDSSQEDGETEPTEPRVDNTNIITEKTVIFDEKTGGYKLRLESYLTGEPTITTDERIPSDIVVVLDQSGSMDDCFYCGDDKADSLVKVYTKLSLTTKYYVKNKDGNGNSGRIYYCDNSSSCKITNSDGSDYSHTAGWYSKSHTSKSTSAGSRFIPSHEDSSYFRARVFYTDSACKTAATNNIVKNGTYYVSISGTMTRVYYCDTCHAWFTTKDSECDAATDKVKHVLSKTYNPDAKSGDASYRTYTFYERIYKHTVTSSDYSTSGKYYVITTDRTTGDTYSRIYYCKTCKNWHTTNGKCTGAKYSLSTHTFYKACPINRNEALTEALDGFLEDIYKDSVGEDGIANTNDDVKNRIAVVGFGSYNETTSGGNPPTNALLSYAQKTSATTATTVGYSDLTASHYKKALHYVNTANGQSVINSAIDSLQMISNTETYRGIEIANNIFKNNAVTAGKRNRIMVVFTDGLPYSGLTDSDGIKGNFAFANKAIENSVTTKNTYGATVYSIGIFSGANASNMTSACSYTGTDNTKRANKFMHLISSNYLKPTTLQAGYTASDVNPNLKTGSSYYLSASTTDALNDIFKSIAQSITGGGAYITTLNGSTVVKDVVTKEFTIPNSGQDISVHTEAFAGEVNKTMTWNDDDNSSIDNALIVTPDGNTVTVTGFDFAKYYVATDVNNGENIPRGRKLVIEIPIDPAETNIGGLAQETNEAASGIYLGGTCYENYEIPTVDIPTDITIQKSVNGSAEDKQLNFAFTTSAKYFANETAYAPAGNDESSGNYLYFGEVDAKAGSFDLKDAETETIPDLLVGQTLTFGETDGTGYVISDYDVTVEIKDANNNDVAYTKDEATGKYSVTVVPGMTIKVTNARRFADLKITKKGAADVDPYQSFIFNVTGPEGYSRLVTIYGNGSTTLKDLPVGTYTVTEAENWSWRYDATTYVSGLIDAKEEDLTTGASVNLSTGSMQVLVTNSRTSNKWLDGNSYCKNIFGSSTPIKQPTN